MHNDKTAVREREQGKLEDCSLISETSPVPPVMRGVDFLPQVIACLTAVTIVIHSGVNMAFSAVLLPQLMTPRSDLPINEDQASWIASIVTISTPVGSLLSGPLMDKFGRKAVCQLTCVPLLASWIIIAVIKNIHGLYCGRLLAGFGSGLSTASLVYISEVSHPTWRPVLLCLMSVFVSLGILVTCVLSVWLSYEQMAICFAVMSLASYLTICPLPESPHWLLRSRTENMARDALRWLYREDACYQYQASCLIDNFKQPSALTSKQKSFSEYFSPYKQSSTIKPIVILLLIFVFQQISGAYVIIFYAVNILQIAGGKFGTGISEYAALVFLGLIRFIMSIFTAFISRKCGRRPVCIVSGIGMAVSMLVTAICINKGDDAGNLFNLSTRLSVEKGAIDFSTQSYNNTSMMWSSHNKSWLLEDGFAPNTSFRSVTLDEVSITSVLNATYTETASEIEPSSAPTTDNSSVSWSNGQFWYLVFILLYVFCSSVGVLVIPWTLVGELLPISVRGSCGGLIIAFTYVVMFGVIKIFPYFLKNFKAQGTFYAFSTTSFCGAVFVYLFLPETRGKSFQEIENYFK